MNTLSAFQTAEIVLAKMNRINKLRYSDEGRILSAEEQNNLPKFNRWEKDFVNNVTSLLQAGIMKSVSPKQVTILEKLYTRLNV